MKRYPRGLVVGKFAPLHRGHELLIQRASEQCDELFVISYANPEPDGCSAELRTSWLTTLFPKTRVLVATNAMLASLPASWPGPRVLPWDSDHAVIHRQFVGQLCQHVFGCPVNVVFTSEDYGDGFAAHLSGMFGFEVAHVCVDRARSEIPISATEIRRDLRACRHWLSPVVNAAFVPRIGILGGESSGKTSLAAALAEELRTSWVPEYGRELWEHRNGKLSEPDLLHIAQIQVAREKSSAPENGVIVCDTTPLTTLFYSQSMFGCAHPELEKLAERTYDLTILCAPDFPFVQDGTRRDAAFREEQHKWYCEQLCRRGISALEVTGSVEERVANIIPHVRDLV